MKTKWWAIALVILSTITLSFAQIFWKKGVTENIFNYNILLGFLMYGISGVILIIALKGGELSVIHPMLSLSLIWVSIMSPIFFLNDMMTPTKWAGVSFMILGVVLIGRGGFRK